MKKIGLILLILKIATLNTLQAQVDPHFSQYYAYPLWLNPALTGVMDGEFRLTGNFKSQWQNIESGYKTVALSSDFKLNERVAIGVSIMNQTAGTAGYRHLLASGSFAYNIPLTDGNSALHFGLQGGFINRSVDPTKFQFGSQYNPGMGYDPNMPTMENLINVNNTLFDAGAGVFYGSNDENKKLNPFGGVGVSHLNNVLNPAIRQSEEMELPIRFTAHGGIAIKAGEGLTITPHALYVYQRNNAIKAAGLQSEFKFLNNYSLFGGIMYRINDSMITSLGFQVGRFSVGSSYDFNTSTLNTATNGQGGLEFSISYVVRSNKVKCPMLTPRF